MNRERVDTVKPVNVEQLRNQAADFDVWLSSKEVRVAKPEIRIPTLSEQRLGSLMDDRPMATYRRLIKHLLTLPEHEQLPVYMYMCGFPDEDIQGVFGADAIESSVEVLRAYELTLQESLPVQTPAKAIAQKAVETVVTLPRQRSNPASRPVPTKIEEASHPDDLEGIEDEFNEDVAHIDIVRQYIKEAAKHKLLTAEEEVLYGQQVQAGIAAQEMLDASEDDLSDEKRVELLQTIEDAQRARDKFTKANLRLVISIARRYPNASLSLLDHIQEGNIGLMRAVEKFDPNRGYKFSGHATWWIREAIARTNHENSRDIRIPAQVSGKIRQLGKATAELTYELGRHPTKEELAAAMELPVEKIVLFRQYLRDMPSLDAPISTNEGSETMGSQIADQRTYKSAEESLNGEMLRKVLGTLTERQCRVVMYAYGLVDGVQYTVPQIARRMHIGNKAVQFALDEAEQLLRGNPHLQEMYEAIND